MASSGWIVPTSLFTSMTDTTTVRSSSAPASASRSTMPSRPAATRVTRKPSRLETVTGREHRLVLERDRDHTITETGRSGGSGRALHGQVVGFTPAGGEDDLAGPRPEGNGDGFPSLLEGRLRGACHGMSARWVAEGARQEGRHGGDRLGPHRGGRGEIEVRAGRVHDAQVYERPDPFLNGSRAEARPCAGERPEPRVPARSERRRAGLLRGGERKRDTRQERTATSRVSRLVVSDAWLGISVIPLGDNPVVTTQLRLVEAPGKPARQAALKRAGTAQGRQDTQGRRRPARRGGR